MQINQFVVDGDNCHCKVPKDDYPLPFELLSTSRISSSSEDLDTGNAGGTTHAAFASSGVNPLQNTATETIGYTTTDTITNTATTATATVPAATPDGPTPTLQQSSVENRLFW